MRYGHTGTGHDQSQAVAWRHLQLNAQLREKCLPHNWSLKAVGTKAKGHLAQWWGLLKHRGKFNFMKACTKKITDMPFA